MYYLQMQLISAEYINYFCLGVSVQCFDIQNMKCFNSNYFKMKRIWQGAKMPNIWIKEDLNFDTVSNGAVIKFIHWCLCLFDPLIGLSKNFKQNYCRFCFISHLQIFIVSEFSFNPQKLLDANHMRKCLKKLQNYAKIRIFIFFYLKV